jgi:NAD(P)-dependent dehydrogenase (short-subunit alcohol dehydrogenase family)
MSRKEALIVGASRGLGLGLVREYLSRGWGVTATVRDLAGAPELRKIAEGAGQALRLETVDIDDGAQVKALARRLEGRMFDLVFVSAGISGPPQQGTDQVTPQDVAALFYTNAVAPIRIAETFAPSVKDQTGVIAFMSSRTGSVSEPSSGLRPLYRASKAALNSMTRSFVTGLKGRPITILSLHPGWVRTDMGGPSAPVDVPTSVAGLADVVEKYAGAKIHAFVDYQGTELVW